MLPVRSGLRTGEVLALRWAHVDIAGRRIHVRESVDGPLKDDDSRMVPIQDALHPVLAAWKLRTAGLRRVLPPMRSDGDYLDPHTVRKHLAKALKDLKVPKMTWYRRRGGIGSDLLIAPAFLTTFVRTSPHAKRDMRWPASATFANGGAS